MRANKSSCSAMARAAILRHERSCAASCYHLKPRFADGIIYGRCAPLARQELRLSSTLHGVDHGGASALADLRHALHGLAAHG